MSVELTVAGVVDNPLRIGAELVDYVLIFVYFAVVLLVGVAARRRISSSLDFFLSGRSLPAWITGLAFISANLGAVEVIGMSANGAEYGMPTMHYYWIGAVPAMLFLGIVMMPFYYGSKVRSVPEFMRRRFGPGAHLVNAGCPRRSTTRSCSSSSSSPRCCRSPLSGCTASAVSAAWSTGCGRP
ncbi:sodium:solute symporter family transporter [Nonomuraea sp. 10N515B]|uniref:sodium:solute symporter family transporter n=1 Tax=Nonomuraea sp. 10N515B TaxID=3457422 RepID=UPI003FCE2F16